MVINIGEFTYTIDGFTVSINKKQQNENNEEGWITSLIVDLDIDNGIDLNAITDGIVENLDSNEVVIVNGSKEYDFSDYEFDGASCFVTGDSERMTLNFVK